MTSQAASSETSVKSLAPSLPGDFDNGPPFVFGFGFKSGVATEMTWEEIAERAAEFDFVWLHLNMNNEEACTWLRAQRDVPYAAMSALLAGETRPRVSTFEKGVVVNLRGVNLNEGAQPEDMVSIRLWIDEKRVITTRRRRLKAAQDIRAELLKGAKIESTGLLAAKLAARLTERAEPYVQEINDEIDALEDLILKGDGSGVRPKLADTRQAAVQFRRFVAPQRDVLTRLAADETGRFDPPVKIELRETSDRVTRMTEEIDAARERAMVLQDQLTDQRAEEMNRNMMILSVAAAVFLPLGFLTGLFGINVGGMPGVDNPMAFWFVCLGCLIIGVGLGLLFKAMKWL
ncbi:MAG: zinc transporter ZntB [Hyphococcus sp.]|nr:MAG: zinc transporter ZntB [Marinicaulis sp.]